MFSGFTLTRLTFLYVKHYLSFIYAYCSSIWILAYLLYLLNNGQHQSKYTQYKQTNRHIYRSCSFRQILL